MRDFIRDSSRVFSKHLQVASCQAGRDGAMRLDSLFEELSEAAAAHAEAHGLGFPQLFPQGKTWVLIRLSLEMGAMPAYREDYTLHTWSRGPSGFIARRDFLAQGAEGQDLIRASSSWLMIDIASRRPQRLDGLDASLASLDHPILGRDAEKLALQAPEGEGTARRELGRVAVRESDIDLNGHVNNAAYIRAMTDLMAVAGQPLARLRGLDVNFLSEAHLGDELGLMAYSGPMEAEGRDGETLDLSLRSGDQEWIKARWAT